LHLHQRNSIFHSFCPHKFSDSRQNPFANFCFLFWLHPRDNFRLRDESSITQKNIHGLSLFQQPSKQMVESVLSFGVQLIFISQEGPWDWIFLFWGIILEVAYSWGYWKFCGEALFLLETTRSHKVTAESSPVSPCSARSDSVSTSAELV
jgi:hypothetical protein